MKINNDLIKSKVYIETCDILQQINKILWKQLFSTKLLLFHKIIVKTIFKLIYLSLEKNANKRLHDEYRTEYGDLAATCLCVNGMLENYKDFPAFGYDIKVLQEDFVKCSLKYSEDTKYFHLAIENYIQAYDFQLVTKNDPFTVTVIMTNLENGHKNIHNRLLDLFRRVVKYASAADEREIMENVLNEMSWYNRNKHYLLSHLIAVRPEMLLNHKDYEVKKFLNGLRIGLSQYHLYSSSLTLIKTIYNKDPFRAELIKISVEILSSGSDYELRNFLTLWFQGGFDLQFREELFTAFVSIYDFKQMSFSTSKDFPRGVKIRNAFDKVLNPQMEDTIKTYCCSIEDVALKIDIFNYLMNEVLKTTVGMNVTFESILRLLKFLQCNMCIQDSTLSDCVMRRLPNFFNFLATTRFRQVDIVREIFTIIRDDLYYHGINYGSYESIAFSVRMLDIILIQYCGGSRLGRRLNKSTDHKSNRVFMQLLKDNNIWDITSNEIFHQLEAMADDIDNSDLCRLASEIIVEHFIKTLNIDGVFANDSFHDWINVKAQEKFNITDVEAYHENISHCIMKFEYLNSRNAAGVEDEIMQTVSDLRLRSAELKISKDLVNQMERGRSLFVLIDTINYAISKLNNPMDINNVIALTPLIKEISHQFLNFVNDETTCPSFDVLDKNIRELLEKSHWKCENLVDAKRKVIHAIFFTFRALSNLTETIVKLVNATLKPHENEYFIAISTCIDVNIQMLSRFCHKGSIEAASSSLGVITKVVSSEFFKQCDRDSESSKNLQKMLIKLKHEIDCGKRFASKTGEIRGSRGYLLMSHLIIKNHPSFLKFLMNRMLIVTEIQSFDDTQKIKFANDILPIHLHLLALLVKDGELVEDMLKYYDFILIATFKAYKESKEFVMQNALLQIIGSITVKISNHKRHCIDEAQISHYESKSISVYEYYVKITYAYRIALFDLERNLDDLPQPYVIILLEIFSNFEYRRPLEYYTEMDRIKYIFETLLSHSCEKIRDLAARCFAQWHLPKDMPKIINDRVRYIFSDNLNLAHGSIVAVRHMIQRYEASVKFVGDFDKQELMKKPMKKVLDSAKLCTAMPANFFLRYHLLDFLLFLGFSFNDDVVQRLLDESNVTSKIGYSLWRDKVKECQQQVNVFLVLFEI